MTVTESSFIRHIFTVWRWHEIKRLVPEFSPSIPGHFEKSLKSWERVGLALLMKNKLVQPSKLENIDNLVEKWKQKSDAQVSAQETLCAAIRTKAILRIYDENFLNPYNISKVAEIQGRSSVEPCTTISA